MQIIFSKKSLLLKLFQLSSRRMRFLMVATGYGVNRSMEKEADLPEMALKNVEALADNEIGNGRWIVTVYSPSHWRCDPDGGASCPGTPW